MPVDVPIAAAELHHSLLRGESLQPQGLTINVFIRLGVLSILESNQGTFYNWTSKQPQGTIYNHRPGERFFKLGTLWVSEALVKAPGVVLCALFENEGPGA